MTQPRPAIDPETLAAHAEGIRRLCRSLVADDARADDVAQETMKLAIERPPRAGWNLRAWLSGVARNTARRMARTDGRRARREALVARPEAEPSTLDVLDRMAQRREVVDAVLALAEPYRTTVALHWFDGLPAREIASLQSVPVETVRTRLKRAIDLLRLELDRRHGGDRRAWSIAVGSLAVPVTTTAGTLAAIAGALAMKKVVVAAVVVLAVGGTAVVLTRPENSPTEKAAGTASAPALVAIVADAPPAPPPELAAKLARADAQPAAARKAALPFTARVVDPEGRPVVGATVESRYLYADAAATVVRTGDHKGPSLSATTTDAEGVGRLDKPEWLSDATGPDAMLIRVLADGFAIRRAVLKRGVEERVVLARGGVLLLRVTDETGRPASDATGQVVEGDAGISMYGGSAQAVDEVMAPSDGNLELRLSPGRYRARIHAKGLRAMDTDVLVVEARRTTERELRLDIGIVAEFHVVDESGSPVVGARVVTQDPLGSAGDDGSTDADGRRRVAGISFSNVSVTSLSNPDGALHFSVEAAGFAKFISSRPLPPASAVIPIEVRLNRGVLVRVRIVDDGGTLVPDSRARWSARTGWRLYVDEREGVRSVGADGWIDLPRTTAGRQRVSASAARDDLYDATSLDVDVGAVDSEVTVVLARRDGLVSGTVLLSDGSPAHEGTVGWEPEVAPGAQPAADRSTVLDGEGRFRLDRLRTGKGRLMVTIPAHTPQPFSAAVASGGTGDPITLRVRPGAPIAGRVVDRGGVPIAGVGVALYRRIDVNDQGLTSSRLVPEAETKAGSDGAFRLIAEEGQSFHIGVTSGDWHVMEGSPREVKAGTEGIVLRMKPASEGWGMSLRIFAKSAGQPYEGRLQVQWKVGENKWAATEFPPDASGGRRFAVSGKPGIYDFALHAPGHRPTVLKGVELAETPEGKAVQVTLDLGASIRLRIRDGEGRPLGSTWIYFNDYRVQVKTDAAGECESTGWDSGSAAAFPVCLASDPDFTSASVSGVSAPGSADVTLRRRGFAWIHLGVQYSDVTSDVIVRLIDVKDAVVDEQRVVSASVKEWGGEARCQVSANFDGKYRITAEMGSKRGEVPVEMKVGERVEPTILWR